VVEEPSSCRMLQDAAELAHQIYTQRAEGTVLVAAPMSVSTPGTAGWMGNDGTWAVEGPENCRVWAKSIAAKGSRSELVEHGASLGTKKLWRLGLLAFFHHIIKQRTFRFLREV